MACGLGPSGVSFDDSLNTLATPGAVLLPGTYASMSSTPGRGFGYAFIVIRSCVQLSSSLCLCQAGAVHAAVRTEPCQRALTDPAAPAHAGGGGNYCFSGTV